MVAQAQTLLWGLPAAVPVTKGGVVFRGSQKLPLREPAHKTLSTTNEASEEVILGDAGVNSILKPLPASFDH